MNKNEVVAGFLCGFIGLLVGSFWLNGSTNWLFDLIATLGSIATAGSFIYIILDNRKLRLAQDNETYERKKEEHKQRKELNIERKKREEHELKQQQLWEEQMAMAAFEKYQRHQVMFDSLLDSLELKHNHLFKFVDRIALYELLFPSNTPTYCEYYIENFYSSFQEYIFTTSKSSISDTISALEPTLTPGQFIQAISLMKNSLRIKFQGNLNIGGFSSIPNENLDINLFDPLLTCQIMTDIVKRLVAFSTNIPTNHKLSLSHPNYSFIESIRGHIADNHSWAGEFKHHVLNPVFLCSYMHLTNLSKSYKYHNEAERKHLLQLETLFESLNNVEAFIEEIESPRLYIERCIEEIANLNSCQNETDFSPSISAYKVLLQD
ncbi:hypothetical protein [Vibrio cyclitrophicus]|uniref:hypothetical protein n=1 Tax=Vibrio cyclitrophicus TaxID=47951 RepID=UPI0032E4C0D7